MKSIRTALCICALCVWGTPAVLAQFGPRPISVPTPAWAKPNANSIIPEERSGLWLVKAESVDRVGSSEPYSVVEITHNYTGPDELVGQRFVPFGPPRGPTGFTPFALMPLGSNGIFVVEWDESRGVIRDTTGYRYDYPVLEEKSERILRGLMGFQSYFSPAFYINGRAYAASIELIAKAPRDKQKKLLKTYVKEPMPELSNWALDLLVQSGWDDVPQFLQSLITDREISLSVQLAVDAQLQSLDSAGKVRWNDSPDRLEFWQRLVSSPVNKSEDGALVVYTMISILMPQEKELAVAQGKEPYVPPIPVTRVFQWLRLAMTNKAWPIEARQSALLRLGSSALNSIPRKERWELALSYLKEHPDLKMGYKPPSTLEESAALALAAIRGLKNLRPFSVAELATLHGLQESAIDPELQKQFDAIFENDSLPKTTP